ARLHMGQFSVTILTATGSVLGDIQQARTLGEELINVLPVESAKQAILAIERLDNDDLPLALILDPIREATAAGAGALLAQREGSRQTYLVIDIGAGTTDVTGFVCVHSAKTGGLTVAEYKNAADAKKMAGNVLDSALERLVLQKSGLAEGTEEYRVAQLYLRRDKRFLKEQLFAQEKVAVELPNDDVMTIELSEFLRFAPVVRFADAIKQLVAKCAAASRGKQSRIKLIATGGGARLPVIAEIAEFGLEFEGVHINFTVQDPMPDEIRVLHPDLIAPYPQISVALGGSMPITPKQITDLSEALDVPPPRTIMPNYKS
ncbi:MAG: hypothetical protein V7703_08245, partial [Hyphomicrobiales bacterium]